MDLDRFLADHDLDFERHEHPAVMTVDEADRLVPPLPAAKTKNLFLRDKKGARHMLVSVPSDCPVDLAALGKLLGAGSVGFASAERLDRHLGVAPGSVTMLALANDADHRVEFYIDRALWEADAVQAHPMVNTATMVIPHDGLVRFFAATGHEVHVIDVPRRVPA